jgi:RNA polymerase subunit RPABC4/transcription elongation factor Spt4
VDQLVRCLECGKQISSAAQKCPHCDALYPLGHECLICLETVKHSESKPIDAFRWVHTACLNVVEKEFQSAQVICPVCKNVNTSEEYIAPYGRDCSSCGHPLHDNYSRCPVCGRDLVKTAAVKDKIYDNSYEGGGGPPSIIYYHKACYVGVTKRTHKNKKWWRIF